MDERTKAQTIWISLARKVGTKSNNATINAGAGSACAGVCVRGPGCTPRNDRPTGGLRWGWSLSQNE